MSNDGLIINTIPNAAKRPISLVRLPAGFFNGKSEEPLAQKLRFVSDHSRVGIIGRQPFGLCGAFGPVSDLTLLLKLESEGIQYGRKPLDRMWFHRVFLSEIQRAYEAIAKLVENKHRLLFIGGKTNGGLLWDNYGLSGEYCCILPIDDLFQVFSHRDSFSESMKVGNESAPYDQEKRESLAHFSIWKQRPEYQEMLSDNSDER